MSQDTDLSELIINKLTQAQFQALINAGTVSETELYMITDEDIIPNQTGNAGKFLTTNGSVLSWGTVDAFPSQSGNNGKFLTTNGTTVSWANIPEEIPSQSGNSGKFLTTNGTTLSWGTVDAFPSQSGNSGKFLTTNGTTVSWASVDAFPDQSGNSGKFLTTNGTVVSWANIPVVDQTYDGTSINAQSGTAVASAIATRTLVTMREWS